MILILSKSNEEFSTNAIIEYLNIYKANYFRFNGDDFINGKVEVNFFINNNSEWDFNIYDIESKKEFSKKNVNVIWFRRHFTFEVYDDNEIGNRYLMRELRRVYSLFEIILTDCIWVNRDTDIDNKFLQLQIAQKVGLLIPFSTITNNNKYINEFLNDKKSYITKSATEVIQIEYEKYKKNISTHRIKLDNIKEPFFFPSYVQEEIIKEYEIRVFYFFSKLYAIAIFSQKNKKTQLDFRNYDFDKPNRRCKYILSKEIERKIISLMNKLNMNSGSIDLIKGIDNKYYFLEVNPVGQFGFVSKFGNYNLEKIISHKLIRIDEKQKSKTINV